MSLITVNLYIRLPLLWREPHVFLAERSSVCQLRVIAPTVVVGREQLRQIAIARNASTNACGWGGVPSLAMGALVRSFVPD